jgi:hypothetical protein
MGGEVDVDLCLRGCTKYGAPNLVMDATEEDDTVLLIDEP